MVCNYNIWGEHEWQVHRWSIPMLKSVVLHPNFLVKRERLCLFL